MQAYFLQFILDEGDRDNHSVTSSVGETNDSAASSPYSTHLHSNEASRTSTAPKIPVNPLQINTTGTGSAGDDGGHAINTSPIKRRASQAEELLKAQDAGGMVKIQFPNTWGGLDQCNFKNESSLNWHANLALTLIFFVVVIILF